VRDCQSLPPPQIRIYPTTPGGPPGGQPGKPGRPGKPPGPPSGSCPPNETRDARTGSCGQCSRPNIQVNGKCCTVGALVANAACSNSSCPSGQTAVGPSNFCCNSSQVYAGIGGAQACCSGPLVNGQCPSPITPPVSTCPSGYVSSGASCCLASQMSSTGACCPAGQVPSGANNAQCGPPILIPVKLPPLLCCSAGEIPAVSRPCCPTANVTTNGTCCAGPVSANDRSHCPVLTPVTPACAVGYTKMGDGTCCNDRFIGNDGMSCISRERACAKGEFRDSSGACAPVASPPSPCAPGLALDRNGNCVGGGAVVPGEPIRPIVPPGPRPRRLSPPPARGAPPAGGKLRR
jgi:hypothetical protein